MGTTLPFLDRTVIKVSLLPSSSQELATFVVTTPLISVTNIEAFIKSIRAIEGNRNMIIDTSLIEFAHQYSSHSGGQIK